MKQKSFTLIEFLVVIAMISILLAIVLANYRSANLSLSLYRSAQKLASDIRRAQEMAMATRKFGETIPKGGYGVYFNSENPQEYIIFADLNDPPNHSFDSNETFQRIKFENEKIRITNLTASPLNIVFVPPDPTIFINDTLTLAEIRIGIVEGDSSKYKIIRVNKAGLIEVQ
jgi:prepilin-type N-terminal cleavage/methylation domain-containing protein